MSEGGDRPITLPPEELELDPDELVLEWAGALDEVDYLALLQLPRTPSGPSDAEVRSAFRAFALVFHPDRHRDAPAEIREAATRVYQRGAEAYRVLLDPLLRRRYLRLLEGGALRMAAEEIAEAAKGEPTTIAALVRSAAAGPFAKRADELLASGDLKQAKLQVQLAAMREPGNARLKEALEELEERIVSPRPRS